MESPKTFQIVVTGIFVVLLVFGFLGFSGKLPLPKSKSDINYGTVTLWGTLPLNTMQALIAETVGSQGSVVINYVEKNSATFDRDFVEALARGKGPDIILLSQDEIAKNLDKLSLVPYQSLTERDFKNTFLQEGEIFLRPEGIVALPFTLDPLVMYWNRDIFTNAGIVIPPSSWKTFYDLAPKITARDSGGNISRSLVSFGGYRNVTNAKEILSLFMMQAGSPIATIQNGTPSVSIFPPSDPRVENPVISAIRFFTEFSKQDKDSYSWNSSLPSSRSMFEAGDLATYFGYAGEYQSIRQKNPHLNFDITVVPQAENTQIKTTFGKMQGIALVRASTNPQGGLQAAFVLSGKDVVSGIASRMGLPPVRRDLISVRPTDAILSVFYDSAIISRAWYDPSASDTNTLFMTMIDDITSGKLTMNQALLTLQSGLAKLFQLNQ